MKANELRIGNLVSHNEEWSYHNELRTFDFKFTDSDWYALGESTLFIENIKPIPLTEEWLIKFGFEKQNAMFYEFNKHQIRLIGDEVPYWIDSSYITNIKHVHQLQNLYFALTGEELKIND